jgi:ParB family chromosome partitioning protein
MDLTSLSNLIPVAPGAANAESQGLPLDIPLDRIIPGDNPRTSFDAQGLERLAASIKARGVKSPISVKRISAAEVAAWFAEQGLTPPAVLEGFFRINHGERRFRACGMAGKPSIPAIVDDHHGRVDSLVENIQRQDLDPLDIANAIKRELDHDERLKKGDIARELGVSASYVSKHLKLLTLPEPVAAMIREGRSKDVTSLTELASAYQDFPEQVADFCATAEEPTQAVVRHFITALKVTAARSPGTGPMQQHEHAASDSGGAAEPSRDDTLDRAPEVAKQSGTGPRQGSRATDADGAGRPSVAASSNARITGIEIRHGGRAAVLLPKAPRARGLAWIRYDGDDHETQIELRTVEEVVALITG